MTAYYVYRVYDGDRRLIYVGQTRHLMGRLSAHQATSWWAPQAAKVKAQVVTGQSEARLAELEAIRSEKPRWNMQGRGSRSDWTAD